MAWILKYGLLLDSWSMSAKKFRLFAECGWRPQRLNHEGLRGRIDRPCPLFLCDGYRRRAPFFFTNSLAAIKAFTRLACNVPSLGVGPAGSEPLGASAKNISS